MFFRECAEPMTKAPIKDKAAMARTGTAVRARLAANPAVYKVPVEQAEIFSVTGFLAPAECAHLIGLIDSTARPSTVYKQALDGRYRTSYSGDVDPEDSFVRMIERRICDLIGIEQSWGETIQGQRYMAGQEFQAHNDWFDTTAEYWPGESRRGGQRCWTAMAYLSDVEAGGETEFPKLGISFPPQPGLLLMWNNALADGTPNPSTVHSGKPVERGVKYIITKWFRTRPWG
jgi:prolyl 4-hydroxylase